MSDTITCRNCGFVNTATDEFCGNCGRFLEWSTEPGGAAEGTAPPAASDAPTAPYTPAETAFTAGAGTGAGAGGAGFVRCQKCGTANPADRTFCLRCGERLGAAAGVAGPPLAVAGGSRSGKGGGSNRGLIVVGGIVLLALLVGLAALAGFFAGSGPRATPGGSIVTSFGSPSPSGLESAVPSPSDAASPSALASPSDAASIPPIASPTPEITLPPTPRPTRRPTPEPTLPPTAEPTPQYPFERIAFEDIGLEDPDNPVSLDRVIKFTSQGTDSISAKVSDVSVGEVELCVQLGNNEPFCRFGTSPSVVHRTSGQSSDWTIFLRGRTPGVAASADLDLRFPHSSPVIELEQFRLSGVMAANGLDVQLRGRMGGDFTFSATWSADATYTLTITDEDDPALPPYDFSGGPSTSANAVVPFLPAHKYLLHFEDEDGFEEVYFSATLTLP